MTFPYPAHGDIKIFAAKIGDKIVPEGTGTAGQALEAVRRGGARGNHSISVVQQPGGRLVAELAEA